MFLRTLPARNISMSLSYVGTSDIATVGTSDRGEVAAVGTSSRGEVVAGG
jgi:hypothetical protein